jgi:hypothetical protein
MRRCGYTTGERSIQRKQETKDEQQGNNIWIKGNKTKEECVLKTNGVIQKNG